jgi:hypothetical protein
MDLFNMDFISRVVAALRAKAKQCEQYSHLDAYAYHLERGARLNLNWAGRTALRLNRVWNLGVNDNE